MRILGLLTALALASCSTLSGEPPATVAAQSVASAWNVYNTLAASYLAADTSGKVSAADKAKVKTLSASVVAALDAASADITKGDTVDASTQVSAASTSITQIKDILPTGS